LFFATSNLNSTTGASAISLCKDILQLKEVVECYNISGDFDFLLKVYAKDMKHYQDFVFNKLGSVTSIGSTHSTFVMSENKNSYNINL
jgi:Lrp/AsnC family leucine-responsive transcriptional regulator